MRAPQGTGDADHSAVTTWVTSRVLVAVVTVATAWTVADAAPGGVRSFTTAWDHWDTGLFVKVARFGYQGYPRHYPDRGVVAFFPGEPLALRAVHLVVRNWVASGLLVSALAGAVACVALARLAAVDHSTRTGERAVLYLVLSPYAVFLAAAYSEALFLAFALPAWVCARKGRWWVAGVLAAGASTVRITGLFLAVALVVQWATDPGRARRRGDAGALALPFVPLALYDVYLHHITGDWLAWQHAQEHQWSRTLTWPWTALHTSWHAAWSAGLGAPYEWSFRAEILAVLVGVVLTLVLSWRRQWGEAVYVGGQVVALATSSYYLSVARTALLWWPLWVLLADASLRRRWLHLAYLSVAPALMVTDVVAFQQGHWVG